MKLNSLLKTKNQGEISPKMRSNTITSGDTKIYKTQYNTVHGSTPFEARRSVIGKPHEQLEIIEKNDYSFHPRHTCMLLMENSKNMQAQLKDNTLDGLPRVIRQYNSTNSEKHLRGINQHGSIETLRNYKEKRNQNADYKFKELHERNFETRNSEPLIDLKRNTVSSQSHHKRKDLLIETQFNNTT